MQNKTLIAVVGMSGVFPQATGNDSFWRNIVRGVDATREVPAARWCVPPDWVVDGTPMPDKAYSRKACLVDGFVFDTSGFVRDPGSADHLEPLCQWVLHGAREALGACRTQELDRTRVGVILAAIALPTAASAALSQSIIGEEVLRRMVPGHGSAPLPVCRDLPGGRVVSRPAAMVAHALGLGGAAYTLDAACASSLYAVQLACETLRAFRADAMITGGVSGADNLYTQIGFSQLRALSPSGRCAPFDRSADGLVVGEGAGILVLKRLDDAQRDGDTIYGVIRGMGLSNDMRGNLLAPETDGQLRAMRAAYTQAGWHPWEVDYIECHGAGTPVGDATELSSLRALWQEAPDGAGPCALGSVKSMIGHLLTGAGAAGMIKTLLGLHHRTLPPSLKFEAARADSPLQGGPFKVQTSAAPWPVQENGRLPRAAVSAFGFGGINAHVLLEAWPAESTKAAAGATHSRYAARQARRAVGADRVIDDDAIAIVGMDLCLGPLSSLEAFRQAVFAGRPALVPPPDGRWKAPYAVRQLTGTDLTAGGFMQAVTVAMGEFQIPPGEIRDILPQQLLMLQVAAGAMRDAGLPLRQARSGMGSVIGIGFDYEAANFHLRWVLPNLLKEWRARGLLAAAADVTKSQWDQWLRDAKEGCGPPLTATRTLGALGGIVASRIAREFRFGGPSFVVSMEEASGLRAIQVAMRMLQGRQVDAMLVGAVDLACDERNLATLFGSADLSNTGRVRPFDAAADGGLPGEGAVALVLKRLSDARKDGDRIYAVIKGMGSAHGSARQPGMPTADTYGRSMNQALTEAGMAPHAVSLVETHGSGVPAQDTLEAKALQAVFAEVAGYGPRVAVGALKPLVGHTGVTAGLASLAKSALSLFHHLLPPLPNFFSPRQATWHNSGFHFPQHTAYWAADRIDGPRTACVAAMTSDGSSMHAVLCQADEEAAPAIAAADGEEQRRLPMGPLPFGLFVVRGEDTTSVMAALSRLENRVYGFASEHSGVLEALAHQWYRLEASADAPHVVAIVAHSIDDLHQQIAQARQAVQENAPRTMGGRGGICHLPAIRGQKGQVAFVFPGSGSHYVGMGRTLGAHWPEVLQSMHRRTGRLKSQMLPHLYDPWRSNWRPGWQTDAYQDLVADPLHTIFGQVVFGGQMTGLLTRFNIRPDAVIGYSLGESAGLFALGAWSDQGRMLERLAASDLFKTQLSGPCTALRRAWGIPDEQAITWRMAVVNRPMAQVDAAVAQVPNVRRLIVNTPNECVIGGLADQVARVVERLKCEAVHLDGVVTVHCDAAQPVAEAYKSLHRFETTAVEGVRFYSCAGAAAYTLSEEACAASIVRQALEGFDFTRTIGQAHSDGVRLFVEVGPQSSCTRMIRQILDDQPHLAVAANTRGEDECLALLKCLGTLAAAGMPVDLAPLYGYAPDRFKDKPAVDPTAIRVPIGGRAISVPPLPVAERMRAETPAAPPAPLPESQWPAEPVASPVAPDHAAAALTDPPPDPGALPEAWNLTAMIDELNDNVAATAQAHNRYLDLSREMSRQCGETFELQNQVMEMLADMGMAPQPPRQDGMGAAQAPPEPVAFTREQCMEFAIGSVGKVLGPAFEVIDTYKARVRLPDTPLMLVDRILLVEGEKCSLGPGRLVTEHDVVPNAWYLDGDRAPVCISVEAGQADLFLSSYLGIDHEVKGERTYRLLDATIRFHRGLPRPGETIRYDIHIDKFVRQGATFLFFFRFEGTIGDHPLITMTNGCAGFFTEQEVRNSGGIILAAEDRTAGPQLGGSAFAPLVPLADEAYTDTQIEALRTGDAAACFGAAFAGVRLPQALRLPGGRMRLIDRIVELLPGGGRFGLGFIKAEADIHPDDWFLTCHFVDDQVMPGTLMYECCAHALRVLLLRLGWVIDRPGVGYEPLPGLPCRLKCRGPVTPQTRRVHYAVEIKEIGYGPEPYVVADAHMYADGRYIVFFGDMSMQMSGVREADIADFWHRQSAGTQEPTAARHRLPSPAATRQPPLFTRVHIHAFAVGRPSEAFGEPYRVFDQERKIARLPGPPYCFMDRVTAIEPPAWVLKADGWVEAEYDVPADGWYFAADRSGVMPFCVLLEIALQPCGWLAAYAGSALKSAKDLKFRNLGGQARLHANIGPVAQTLIMRTRITKVSEAADMIIENFDFEVLAADRRPLYTGNTYFGFFTAPALAEQKGLREAVYAPGPDELAGASDRPLPADGPIDPDQVRTGEVFAPRGLRMPAKALCMLDGIDLIRPDGGPHGLGYIRGYKRVDPGEWFFKAHFFEDPVCPGSLGIESFLQLMKYAALQRWPALADTHRFEMVCGNEHQWQYRGQVIPTNQKVTVQAVITRVEEGAQPTLFADGWLHVDGLCIYKMVNFGLRLMA
jgi:acyl transferase domain-containing protein/3-hydroxymyristoyl/3-hydroxydecanoyl-(acyl carrier protein) dehydratase